MGKYEPLGQFLRQQKSARIRMTFLQIERILKAKLPPSKSQRSFWSNNPSNNVMTRQWLQAGFKTADINIEEGQLVFKRDKAGDITQEQIDEFWKRFESMKGMVTIMPGVDLTAPVFDESDWETDDYGRDPKANQGK